ncbi:MAG: hypothetical protein ABFD54_13325 [Armatimonadota bacterium]|nr:hypothetical protein [bacterium]
MLQHKVFLNQMRAEEGKHLWSLSFIIKVAIMAESIDFSLAGGGLLSELMQRLRLEDRTFVRALIFLIIAWLPLLIFSLVEGLAIGKTVRIPFLEDAGVYGRILIAIPVFIAAEIPIGRRTREVLRGFITSQLVCEQDIHIFNDAVGQAMRQKELVIPEIIILCGIYAVASFSEPVALTEPVTTWYRVSGNITPTGHYYAFVSLPIFQFLLIRWIWKLIIWTGLLWRISRMNLQLLPIHPDKMGGLGFLGLAQIPFGLIGFAGGAVISSHLANGMMYRGASFIASSGPIVAYVILVVLIILAPILVFTDRLIQLRAKGILTYGGVGEEYARLFDQKWVKGVNPEDEIILGSSDIQSLADLRNSYDIVQNMSIIAADRKTITVIVATTIIPMIPLFFVAFPFDEIIVKVLGILR